MKSRRIGLLAAAGGLVALLAITPLLAIDAEEGKPDRLEPLYPAPSFTMTDSNGRTFSTDALKGKVWIADFMFTQCPGICPTMSTQMAKLHRLFADYESVHFVSITVDPEYDSLEVLTDYASKFKADTARWHFLRGDMKLVQELSLTGFKLSALSVPADHSARFVLVDQVGNIRGYYDSLSDEDVRLLSEDIADLLKQAPGR